MMMERTDFTDPLTEAFGRGHSEGYSAGKIDARLSSHDSQFADLKVTLPKVGVELRDLTLAVQRLGDEAKSRDATVLTTAAALKEAKDTADSQSNTAWTPFARFFVAGSTAAALLGLYLAIRPGG